MKIAIITYMHALNYGAELQAFALHQKLITMGYDATLLDVCRPGKNSEYVETGKFLPLTNNQTNTNLRVKILMTKVVSSFLNIFFGRRWKKRNEKFYSFHKQYSNLSQKRFHSFDSLYSENLDYTHFITGSDQVWNFAYPFSVEPFFLTFVDSERAKKIAYAASIGHNSLPDNVTKSFKEWLSDFSSISLREASGVKLIQPLTKKSVEHVLDPTLLLTKSEWKERLNIEKSNDDKYVLLYLLSYSPYSITLAKTIAQKIGAKVVLIETKMWSRYMFDKGVEILYSVGPKEFVELFANASYVVTNSFHGTAFSINFNIPFFSTPKSTKKTNSRFISILSKTSLNDRLLYEGSEFPEIGDVDFSQANGVINDERDKSLQFLINALD